MSLSQARPIRSELAHSLPTEAAAAPRSPASDRARRHRRGVLLLTASLAGIATTPGCDPCAGLAACQGDRSLRAGGWIVDRSTGKGVPGVSVTFVPADPGGAALPEAISSEDGRWETSLTPAGTDSVTGSFHVDAPGKLPYQTGSITIRAFDRGGGEELGRWTSAPFFAFTGELRFPDRQPREARVTFDRTSGGTISPAHVMLEADRFGRFFIQADVLEADTLVGSFLIEHLDMPKPVTIEGVRMSFKHRDEALPLDRVLRVGPSLEYVGRLWRRGAGELVPAEGVQMEFRRIGGIEVVPSVKRSTTVDWGGFNLVFGTYYEGEVHGELSAFLPPDGERVVLDTLTLTTFDGEELREAGEWVIGP